MVEGLGFRVWFFGFRVEGSGFRDYRRPERGACTNSRHVACAGISQQC